VDRLQSSTLLDRRDASVHSEHCLGCESARGMDVLQQVLEMDRTDCEIISLALDIQQTLKRLTKRVRLGFLWYNQVYI